MDDLWAITAYFNPMGFARRLANYRLFRRQLNVPLVTVEWSWSGGEGFQLQQDDADVLVQVRGRDLMWQKERLLNLALDSLPNDCGYVAWLDCDVVFEDPGWHEAAERRLRDVSLVHLGDTVCDLRPDQSPPINGQAPLRTKRSVMSADAMPTDIFQLDFDKHGYTAGHAWAGRTDLLREHRFYDALVIGGGDRAVLYAGLGAFDDLSSVLRVNAAWADHYQDWARAFHHRVRGRVGGVAGRLWHLWHGQLEDRRYFQRHADFAAFEFDPHVDLAEDQGGGWRWNSDKPDMHRYVREYFALRREDG